MSAKGSVTSAKGSVTVDYAEDGEPVGAAVTRFDRGALVLSVARARASYLVPPPMVSPGGAFEERREGGIVAWGPDNREAFEALRQARDAWLDEHGFVVTLAPDEATAVRVLAGLCRGLDRWRFAEWQTPYDGEPYRLTLQSVREFTILLSTVTKYAPSLAAAFSTFEPVARQAGWQPIIESDGEESDDRRGHTTPPAEGAA